MKVHEFTRGKFSAFINQGFCRAFKQKVIKQMSKLKLLSVSLNNEVKESEILEVNNLAPPPAPI